MQSAFITAALFLFGFIAGTYLGFLTTQNVTKDIEVATTQLSPNVREGPAYVRLRGLVRSISSSSSLTVDTVSPFDQSQILPISIVLEEKTTVMREGIAVEQSTLKRGDNITVVVRRVPGRLRATAIFIHTPMS